MWFAVETAFVDGKHVASRPCFSMDVNPEARGLQPGTCHAEHYEEPHNRCQKFLDGLIEIHTDWFQTKEQAMQFVNGTLTYVVHMDIVNAYRTGDQKMPRFRKWETVPIEGDREPFRGIYEFHDKN